VAHWRRYQEARTAKTAARPEGLWKSWQTNGAPNPGREAVTFKAANAM
jgi:hypothetical protein